MSTKSSPMNPPAPSSEDAPAGGEAVASAADAILEQCGTFVEQIPAGIYARDSKVLPGGTVGKHARHVLDHFSAIFVGVDTGEAIMYDRRERHVPMEVQASAACACVRELRARLASLPRERLDAPVRVRVMLAGDGTEAELTTTLARELAFATHHAVHHHAMMKAIAAEFGQEVGAEFGKAPSTIHFERRVAPGSGSTPKHR